MSLSHYLRVLTKRWWIIALGLLTGIGLAYSYNTVSVPLYESQTRLFVSTISAGSTSELLQSTAFGQQRVRSYADVVSSPLVLQPVIDDLGLDVSAGALGRQVSAEVPLNTVIIVVTVTNTDPQTAQDIAARIGQELEAVVSTLEPSQTGGVAPVKLSTIQPAALPLAPSSPQVFQNLAIGSLAGIILGLAIAFLIEALDTRIRNDATLLAVHQAPVLGRFAFDSSVKRRPLLVHTEPGSPRAEAFRHMRTNLQFIAAAQMRNSFVISSALPGEGKSTTSINLAIAAAQSDIRVLLIDGDLRRPTVAAILRLAASQGLTGLLTGKAQVDDVIKPWGDGNLSVLPAGKIPPNPSELLASKQMQELMAWAEKTWDLVIVDSPPILPATDALILSQITGGVILVVRAGKTTRGQLGLALEHLVAAGGSALGYALTMLSGRDAEGSAYGYSGKYGYTSTASAGELRPGFGGGAKGATTPQTTPQTPAASATKTGPRRGTSDQDGQADLAEWLDQIGRQPPSSKASSR